MSTLDEQIRAVIAAAARAPVADGDVLADVVAHLCQVRTERKEKAWQAQMMADMYDSHRKIEDEVYNQNINKGADIDRVSTRVSERKC